MRIRVIKEQEGVFAHMQLPVGLEIEAKERNPNPHGRPFCVVQRGAERLILRDGEYERLPGAGDKKPPEREEKEDNMEENKTMAPAQPETPPKKKPGRKPKMQAPDPAAEKEPEITAEQQEIAGLQEIIHGLRQELAEETKKRYKAERALLAMALEKYA